MVDSSSRTTFNPKFTESQLQKVITDATLLNKSISDTKLFIQNAISSNKLVFNQRQPNYLADHKLSSSLIGQLEFNDDAKLSIDHALKIRYLNDLIKIRSVSYTSHLNTVFTVPMLFKRVLNVYKRSYDDISDVALSIRDMSGKVLSENAENFKCSINAVACHMSFVLVSLTDYKTGRDLLKLYNNSLEMITCSVLEFKANEVFMNDSFIYAKLDANYPFLLKFDYNLVKQEMVFEADSCSDLFLSFVVDKLIYVSSSLNRIYFMDNCFAKIKIYSELTGALLESIHMGEANFRDCFVCLDASLLDKQTNSELFICLNTNEKRIRLYDTNGRIVAENELASEVTATSKFYLTQDGSYVFVDDLNDSVYYYH